MKVIVCMVFIFKYGISSFFVKLFLLLFDKEIVVDDWYCY